MKDGMVVPEDETSDTAAQAAHSMRPRFDGRRNAAPYAKVGWTFGLDERAWPIFGKVRYTKAERLARRFDVDAYVAWVKGLSHGG